MVLLNVGIVADIRRRTRALYHKAVKQGKREKESIIAESMASSLQTNNLTEFWRTVKKHTHVNSCLPSSVDDVNTYTARPVCLSEWIS